MLSPFLPSGSLDEETHTHSRTVRLPPGVDARELSDRLASAIRHWWGSEGASAQRLWSEPVPAASSSDLARKRLLAERNRLVRSRDPYLRAVLLTYSDGLADLVLTSHRSVLDAPSLKLIEEVLTGRVDCEEIAFRDVGPAGHGALPVAEPLHGHSGARIAWSAGTEDAGDAVGVVEVALAETTEDPLSLLCAAAGIVLARYTDGSEPAIGLLLNSPRRPRNTLGPFDTAAVLAFDLSAPTATVGALVKAAEAVLGGTSPDDAGPDPQAAQVVLGLVADGLPAHGEERTVFQRPPFPLTLMLRLDGGVPSLTLHHLLKDIDGESAYDFARHVAAAFAQLPGETSRHPRYVDFLTEDDRSAGVSLDTGEHPMRVDELFERRAGENPDAVAVTCAGASISYRRLNERADRCAAGLRALGARPGERIGICLERSLDLVVAMLAVLKADAVYVPIDPAYPAERIAYTAHDANLRFVVTEKEQFSAHVQARPVTPEQLESLGADSPRPPVRSGPEVAAYVIYTSGSTGRPKGVVVPHRNLTALLAATRDEFALGPSDTWTLFHSSAFDFSVWEIWGALLTGAHLVVVPYEISRSPEDFHHLLAEHEVTVLNQTPSAFTHFMRVDGDLPILVSLRLVIFGGEALDTTALRGWFDRYPESRCRLVNMYGITETTVHVTAQDVTRREALSGSRSVGYALPGWHVGIRDALGRPVPAGVAGEIHVGGEGVALEYHGRPELTAERFVTGATGERLYRTGDRGRLLRDGRLEHLGRLDNQIKLRGFRVELDEIRNTLLADPDVTAAAVVLNDSTRDAADLRIDAYVVLAGPTASTAAVVRRAARWLPEHMVPGTVTAIPALPLTPNGKLDRGRLPAPSVLRHRPPEPVDLATNGFESALIEVWESVFGIRVGVDDSFFDIGGNSLYAIQIDLAMKARSLPHLPIRQLYLTPTIRALAEVLEPEQKA